MDEEGIGLVLAKAIELKLKISNCIHKTQQGGDDDEEEFTGVNGDKTPKGLQNHVAEFNGEDGDEEGDRLLSIIDALESLENQLSSLQALQHQQRYEREVSLAEIDDSRRILLEKLKEYKGEGLEVIQEASAFASEKVEHDNDLILPPYPTRPPNSLVSNNGYLYHLASAHKSIQNGMPSNEVNNQTRSRSSKSGKGLMHVISSATKTMLTLIGVVSVLSLSSGFGKGGFSFKFLGMENNGALIKCPPGKVVSMEGGEARCVVRERIAVPLESVIGKPYVNYGCG